MWGIAPPDSKGGSHGAQRTCNDGPCRQSRCRAVARSVFLTFALACPAISMAADAATAAPAAQTGVVTTVADAQDAAVTPSPVAATTGDVQTAPVVDNHPWWFWPVALLFFCFILGIIAVMAGVGGGVALRAAGLGLLPFHLDFVRGAGLLVALAGALAAGPGLLRRNFANLRLALPVALIASACSIAGAMLGLALPTDILQMRLGVTILGIAVLLFFSKNSVRPEVSRQDAVGMALGMNGVFLEPSTGEVVDWKTHRTLAGLLLFIVIGIMAGMFGLGAGWANVPVLNLLMGVPLKVSVGTSQVPAFHHRHLRRLGLSEPGLRDPADGHPVHRGPDARFRGGRAPAGQGQAQVHPHHGHRRAVFLWRQGAAEGPGLVSAGQ